MKLECRVTWPELERLAGFVAYDPTDGPVWRDGKHPAEEGVRLMRCADRALRALVTLALEGPPVRCPFCHLPCPGGVDLCLRCRGSIRRAADELRDEQRKAELLSEVPR